MGALRVADVFEIANTNREKITGIEKDLIEIRGDVKDTKDDISCIKLEIKESKESVQQRLRVIENFSIEAGITLKVVRWAGILITSGILGLIVSIMTGRAEVIFK